MLRRALSQQAPVREALYEGILQVGPGVAAAAQTLPQLPKFAYVSCSFHPVRLRLVHLACLRSDLMTVLTHLPVAQVLAADPASSELLSELLLPHLRSYLPEDDQQLPPLLLQKCAQLSQVRTKGVLLSWHIRRALTPARSVVVSHLISSRRVRAWHAWCKV